MTALGRRQLLVIVSAVAMLLISGGVVGALVGATQSDGGREWIRSQVARVLNQGLRGHLHVGKISGSFITDLTVDSLELRDLDDSVYIASGRVSVRFDPRDLADGRIIFRAVELDHPVMIIRHEIDGVWNFRKIFPVEDSTVPQIRPPRDAFGALVVLNNIRVRGAEVQLTQPWVPDDSLRGARRDSAIAFNLADPTNEVRRVTKGTRRGYQRTWRWKDIDGEISRLRFRHPDSTGRQFDIARLEVNETIPPFKISQMHGRALWRGDTVWFEAPRFSLPGSVGNATGKVEWPTGDTFWDVHMQSDSTALEDIHWIYPTLPRVGHGSMRLHVKSRANPDLVDYAITDMDVHSEGSRLRGTMTYGTGGAVLEARDVNLTLEPVDFRLLETLHGGPFPYPWRGALTGTVHASGGLVNRFKIERADIAFADGNVAGATAKGTGAGEVDILSPGDAKFHGFHLDVDHFDLRTAQFLNAEFPRLNGAIAGTATLDSIWTDVRISDADLTHRDGDSASVSRLRGNSRLTLGDNFVAFDVTGTAQPLAATTIAQSFPSLMLRGDYRGPIRVLGTVADLSLTTDLVGDGGRIQLDGRFDMYAPGYRAVASGTVTGMDFQKAFGTSAAPQSNFDGRFSLDLGGDSLANLGGTAQLHADRSIVDGIRVFGGAASLRFAAGRVRVDSARVESAAGELTARGGLGLIASATDTLRFVFAGDSLGGLRRYIARVASPDVAADSLAGTVRASGALRGQVSRFALDAELSGTGLLLRTTTARELRAHASLASLPDSATGEVSLHLDGLRAGDLALNDGELRADVRGGKEARVVAQLTSAPGTELRGVAELRRHADTTIVRVDSLVARTRANRFALARTATIEMTGTGFRLDTVVLAGALGGRITAAGRTNSLDTIAVSLRADAVPLADVGELLQTKDPMAGAASLIADVRGTRSHPDLFFRGSLARATVGGLRLDTLDADGRYADRRLTASLALGNGGVQALHADVALPIDLALEPAGSRLPEEPLSAHIRTDSATLALLEAFLPSVHGAKGTLKIDLDVNGTWKHPRATGSLTVAGGSLALRPMGTARMEGIEADVGFLGDSIAVRRFSARSVADRTGSASITGYLGIRDASDATFGLAMNLQQFNVLNEPHVADLFLTGNLALTGRRSAARLAGGFTVDRGEIRLSELYQKRLISLDDPSFLRVVDTTALIDRHLLATGDTVFMNNLQVNNVSIRMGPDVWLRSEEANIGLGGFVSVTRSRAQQGANAGRSQLVLEGPLQTVRGTYRLNLGLVQRSFTVQSGEVRFYGDPDLNATLNIDAAYTVRQVSQQGARPDVRVNVHIGGTRLSPTASLSSPDSARVTTADLISYLTTGGPSSEISGRGGDPSTAPTRALVTTFGEVLGGKLSGGVICDDAQLSTAGLEGYQGRLRSVSGQVLQGTRLNCGKQLNDRLFVRLDAGLCQVGRLVDSSGGSTGPGQLQDAFGAKLDVRLATDLTLSAGVEPPSSAVYCRDDATARGFAPTPRQFGFDLFRLWRF